MFVILNVIVWFVLFSILLDNVGVILFGLYSIKFVKLGWFFFGRISDLLFVVNWNIFLYVLIIFFIDDFEFFEFILFVSVGGLKILICLNWVLLILNKLLILILDGKIVLFFFFWVDVKIYILLFGFLFELLFWNLLVKIFLFVW